MNSKHVKKFYQSKNFSVCCFFVIAAIMFVSFLGVWISNSALSGFADTSNDDLILSQTIEQTENSGGDDVCFPDETFYNNAEDINIQREDIIDESEMFHSDLDSSVNVEPYIEYYESDTMRLFETSSKTYKEGDTYVFILPPAHDIIIKAGYTKYGYYTNMWKDENGNIVFDDVKLTDGQVRKLYNIWEPCECTITANANGGYFPEESTTSIMYIYDSDSIPTSKYTSPEKTGYTFNGWYTKPTESGSEIKEINNSILEDVGCHMEIERPFGNVYAHWQVNTYEIEFDKNKPTDASNDVEGNMENLPMIYDTSSPLSENKYALKGWKFNGWNTKEDGTGQMYEDKTMVQNLSSLQGDVVKLYAQWVANEHNVYFDNDGGEGKVKSIQATFDSPMPTLGTSELPTKDGYKFLGYFAHISEFNFDNEISTSDKTADVQYYNADGTSAKNWDIDKDDTVLMAHWEAIVNPVIPDSPVTPNQNQSTMASTSDNISEFMLIVFVFLAVISCCGIRRYSK